MLIQLSTSIQDDIKETVRSSASQSLVLDVFATAESIRRKHEDQNVALEDIANMVARAAAQYGCALEFGDRGAHLVERPLVLS
ncbi:hypothetical protein [Bosea vaviloviae]|uniref:Uncharacterized protein n=1 Tax=Bosea vaviloviae TaxID=1526658 RepID=A0A1D7TXE6_9HYPH|nr:hypothetical protein [Bosea vaviloviae]AOO79796.1 hypothetical protein BHK69_04270 [Bosea vaviloviae]